MTRLLFAAGLVLATSPAAWAVGASSAMQAFFDANISGWIDEPVLIDAIVLQNETTARYDGPTIEAMDKAWRDELGAPASPTIDPVLTHPASDFLRARVAASGGTVTEIFVMDSVGLNVASSGMTSDYWQGDEEKFSQTFGEGAGAMHFSEIEFDESSQTYQAQISFTLTDPESGAPIGAMTVGIDAEALM
ncbi:hypothetical protein [Citreimonas salinaria]|uniref:Uncharacterized protein n=1 Tax=Citreimonas salinaria TaxID=321339 RepID=A0A1H3KUQ3_9RHOB|nr:hypothetical protein [Citreimonas salinaria]SDY55851.1 hypothetical protein SAMN05444340_110121 [Citreimonas salinaria]